MTDKENSFEKDINSPSKELMQAAGVVPVHLTDCSFINIRKGYDVGTDCCPAVEDERLKCEDCEHSKETQLIYPAFTPAKQLELIKLLAERRGYGGIGEQIDYFTEISGLTFENAIAQITSNAISSKILNKSEVKRILEDD